MSKAFTSEETPDQVIGGRKLEPAPPGQRRPITAEGHHAFTAEHAALSAQSERSPEAQHRLELLTVLLASVEVMPAPPPNADEVRFGHQVEVEDENGTVVRYRLVGPDEADAAQGKVSIASPLGRALLGNKVGDTVEVARPRGKLELTLKRLS